MFNDYWVAVLLIRLSSFIWDLCAIGQGKLIAKFLEKSIQLVCPPSYICSCQKLGCVCGHSHFINLKTDITNKFMSSYCLLADNGICLDHLIANHFHEVKCEEETADSGWKFECQIKERGREREGVSEKKEKEPVSM